ncbi:hypothetical protein [Kitasatospora sp. NPDC007106]|uniref:hypothetical protein n=1 Tax=Kitasatospora sp. NPDC007106 TaxID=3156914 RepID=UPI0033D1EF13
MAGSVPLSCWSPYFHSSVKCSRAPSSHWCPVTRGEAEFAGLRADPVRHVSPGA